MRRHKNFRTVRQRNSKILAALSVIGFGVIFLAERAGVQTPHWLLSWESILIVAGLISLYRHNFQSLTGYILLSVGGLFIANDIHPGLINQGFIYPAIVIVIGIVMLVKTLGLGKKSGARRVHMFDEEIELDSEDFISSSTMFGGVQKTVVSKNFQGGEFTTMFGGTEINLSQADIQKPIHIDGNTFFGGLKLIVPSTWKVNSEMTAIFGGVEDKRPPSIAANQDEQKVLTLTGNCMFGGVEILSYV